MNGWKFVSKNNDIFKIYIEIWRRIVCMRTGVWEVMDFYHGNAKECSGRNYESC
jgi:hypothetical protein